MSREYRVIGTTNDRKAIRKRARARRKTLSALYWIAMAVMLVAISGLTLLIFGH